LTRSTHNRRTAGFGASRLLQRIPAIVSFLNPQPALSLVGGNRSSRPFRPFGDATKISAEMIAIALFKW
jgi:hypothetical protein